MEQYILKDVLVAEITHKIKVLEAFVNYLDGISDKVEKAKNKIEVLGDMLLFIDTLEVKEVDLEKEIDRFYGMYRKDGKTFLLEDNEECVDWKIDCNPEFEKSFAKHFFELGMVVSNKAQNIWHDANEKLPTGVIVVSNGGHLHIGWSTDEGDGIEDEHGHLITKTYQKWAREKDLT